MPLGVRRATVSGSRPVSSRRAAPAAPSAAQVPVVVAAAQQLLPAADVMLKLRFSGGCLFGFRLRCAEQSRVLLFGQAVQGADVLRLKRLFRGQHAGNTTGRNAHHRVRYFFRPIPARAGSGSPPADRYGPAPLKMVSSSILPLISRKEVGSSNRITSGCWHSARASRMRWRWPSLMRLKSRSASCAAPPAPKLCAPVACPRQTKCPAVRCRDSAPPKQSQSRWSAPSGGYAGP